MVSSDAIVINVSVSVADIKCCTILKTDMNDCVLGCYLYIKIGVIMLTLIKSFGGSI